MQAPIATSEFLGLDSGSCYLYTGAHAPTLRSAHRAMTDTYALQSRANRGREDLYQVEVDTRTRLAALAGCEPEQIAVAGDASTLWNSIAAGLAWEQGDNVVVNDLEHPSVYYPFLAQRARGLEVRFAHHDDNWELPVDRLLAACDERTRAIAVSSVAYVNSYRHDLTTLAAATRAEGIELLVDWSHSLGVQKIEPEQAIAGVCASYKWLLGPYGVGIAIASGAQSASLTPGSAGWRSTGNMFDSDRFDRLGWHEDARRFQLGAPAFAPIAALGAGAQRLLEVGIEAVQDHSRTLTELCTELVLDAGLEPLSPVAAERRGGSVAIICPDAEVVAEKLAAQDIHVWGGDGRLRASFHAFNTDEDAERFVAAARATVPRG